MVLKTSIHLQLLCCLSILLYIYISVYDMYMYMICIIYVYIITCWGPPEDSPFILFANTKKTAAMS